MGAGTLPAPTTPAAEGTAAGQRAPLRVSVGGPLGAGKTTLLIELCRRLTGRYALAIVTNDAHAREDAHILERSGLLVRERIVGVAAGACAHDSVADDVALNLAAIEALEQRHARLDVVFIEGSADLTERTFDPQLADLTIALVDVAAGGKAVRRGIPAIAQADLLVINKSDLAAAVGVSLHDLERDAIAVRDERPYVFTDLRAGHGVERVVEFVVRRGMLA
jgi:urease accessory protein